MTDKQLRVGVVGCGLVSVGQHIPLFARMKNEVELQAVCDQDENLARKVAEKFGVYNAYQNLTQMMAGVELDLVDICAPPRMHVSLALEAIEHGCNVLTEKPMALTVADCDRMIEAAHKHKVKLCVIHNILFESPFIKAKKLVADGAIGDFLGMRILMSDPKQDMLMKKDHWYHKLPAGLVGETMPHAVYMSLAFLGKVKNVEVYAKNFTEHPWARFDEFRIELEGERAMSSITISYASNRRNLYVDILGTEAALYLDLASILLIRQGAKNSMPPADFIRYLVDVTSQVAKGVTTNAIKKITGNLKYGHTTLIETIVHNLLNGQESPVTGEDGREAIRVIEMITNRFYEKYGDPK